MPKLFAFLFSLVPLGVGLSVLGLVWSEPFVGFGSIPIFIRLFASCVAAPFVLIGLAGIYGAFTGSGPFEQAAGKFRTLEQRLREQGQNVPGVASAAPLATSKANYTCPNCSATLGDRSDVSPHGDAKCTHCNRWFNIHSRA